MKSQLTDEFVSLFRRLPASVQSQSRGAYWRWKINPAHPGLIPRAAMNEVIASFNRVRYNFKKLSGTDSFYSIRVGLGWRVVGLLEGDTIT